MDVVLAKKKYQGVIMIAMKYDLNLVPFLVEQMSCSL